MPTATGYKNRMIALGVNENLAKRLAKRLAYRAQMMQEEFDFFAELRILGVHLDPTPAQAIPNLEGGAA